MLGKHSYNANNLFVAEQSFGGEGQAVPGERVERAADRNEDPDPRQRGF